MTWFDDWAKRSARRAAVPPQQAGDGAGMTRRDMLKKAGIVGVATVWAAPVIQSVTAPAYAQPYTPVCTPSDSSGACGGNCPTKCGFNRTCTAGSDCLSGTCTSGKCAKSATGGSCLLGSDCNSGTCLAGTCRANAVGGTCQSNADCTSANCNTTTHVCAASANGGACTTTADCSDTAHTATCISGVCKAHNQGTCTSGSGCVSGTCTSGKCKGVTGDSCQNNGECNSGTCNNLGGGVKVCT